MEVYSGKVRSGKQIMLNRELDIKIKHSEKRLKVIERNTRCVQHNFHFWRKVAYCRWIPSIFRIDALSNSKHFQSILENLFYEKRAEIIKLRVLKQAEECCKEMHLTYSNFSLKRYNSKDFEELIK